MNLFRFKRAVFLLEAINALGTTFYFNYLFFLLKHQFGFSIRANLLVCALNGFAYIFFAYLGGKIGQRRGYLFAFGLGSAIMVAALFASLACHTAEGLIAWMLLWTLGVCLTWPNLEAMASDHEAPQRLPRVVGMYNCVWALGQAIGNFVGGAIIGPDFHWDRIFWIPALAHLLQLGFALGMMPAWRQLRASPPPAAARAKAAHPAAPRFLRLAWLANPLSYIAINTIVPLLPELSEKFGLTPQAGGFFCSIWFFARFAAFVVLALWAGWHYRFSHLAVSYVGLIFCFAGIFLAPNPWVVAALQGAFGWCIGLIYYSSLYYSMDAGDQKGEHGGMHEAAIGAGLFGGPAISALSLSVFPTWQQSNVWGVVSALAIGGAVLAWMGRKRRVS
jgi:MFS family permease